MARVFYVFKEGVEYKSHHVRWFKKQLPYSQACPLKYNWPNWWSKMNLFNPDITGDILYFDLDTVITGEIDEYTKLDSTHVLSDFFYPEKSIGSGMMYIKQSDKKPIWDAWMKCPEKHMKENYGDQDFLNKHLWNAKRWQNEFRGEIISYKAHLSPSCKFYEQGYNLDSANVVCFHGEPRPWNAKKDWIHNL